MSGGEILRQLLWKYEATLGGLARELGGPGTRCLLRSLAGVIVWDSESGVRLPGGVPEPSVGEAACAGSSAMESVPPAGTSTNPPAPPGPDATDAADESEVPAFIVPLAGIGRLEVHATGLPPGPVELASLGRFFRSAMETEEELDRLVEEHIANTNQLVALYHIIGATHETWALEDKLEVMLEEAGRQIGTGLAFLRLTRGDSDLLALWPAEDPDLRVRAERMLARCAAESGVFIGDEPEPFVAAPVLVRDHLVGWLGACERPGGEPLGHRDIKQVAALAELSAGFVQTARLQDEVVANTKLQREVEIAAQIQEMLMPRTLPRVPGIEVAASCRPASRVGGDFYVVQDLPDGRMAFALGDVTGKGVPAALIMAMTRTVFRTLTPLSVGPEVVLERLSQVLYADLEGVGKFVTLVLGFWDPRWGRLQVANAGHSPVLYRPASNSPFVVLEPELPPLGVLPDPVAPPLDLEFGPGAVFLACSDGITEARDPRGGFYGDERLLDLATRLGRAGAGRLRERILEDVALFADGAPQSDDQTILVFTGGDPVGGARKATCVADLRLRPVRAELAVVNHEFDRLLADLPAILAGGLTGAATTAGAEMKLALHEAVANVIDHAGLPADAEIGVHIEMDAAGMVAEIENGGVAFDPTHLATAPPNPEELLEGGYGLHLVHALTDSIEYEPGKERHRLRLRRDWRAA